MVVSQPGLLLLYLLVRKAVSHGEESISQQHPWPGTNTNFISRAINNASRTQLQGTVRAACGAGDSKQTKRPLCNANRPSDHSAMQTDQAATLQCKQTKRPLCNANSSTTTCESDRYTGIYMHPVIRNPATRHLHPHTHTPCHNVCEIHERGPCKYWQPTHRGVRKVEKECPRQLQDERRVSRGAKAASGLAGRRGSICRAALAALRQQSLHMHIYRSSSQGGCPCKQHARRS